MIRTIGLSFLGLIVAGASMASAGPIGVDGVIGAEWTGVSTVHVTHDASAPVGNFGTPGNTTQGASYDVRVRDDGTYYYVAVNITGDAGSSAGAFANLYFDTDPPNGNGSDVGFEVTNNRYFIAGDPGGNYYDATPYLTYSANSGVVELAIANTFFTSGTQAGLGFPAGYPIATGDVTLRLSQSFGYSVAGGDTYGPNRLGSAAVVAPVPLPSSAAGGLLLLGVVGGHRLVRRRFAQV